MAGLWSWFKRWFIGEDGKEDCEACDQTSIDDGSSTFDELYQDLLRRNTTFHDIMTSFNVVLADESSKLAHIHEESRELLHWAFQQRESADKFREMRKKDFLSVVEAFVERLAAKVEMLAAEKDWLLGKQSEQDTLRDELMRTRNEVLRQVLKDMQNEFYARLRPIGTTQNCADENINKVKLEAEVKLLDDFWKQLALVNEVISDGESRLNALSTASCQQAEKIEQQRRKLSQLQQLMDVSMLRFVSENEGLLNGARYQLETVEILNDIRHLTVRVEQLQTEIMRLKNQRQAVEIGLEVLRGEDVDIGRSVTELGKYLQFLSYVSPVDNVKA